MSEGLPTVKYQLPSPGELDQLESWLQDVNNPVPDGIRQLNAQVIDLYKALVGLIDTNRSLADRLQELMGLKPKSERGSQLNQQGEQESTGADAAPNDDMAIDPALTAQAKDAASQLGRYGAYLKRMKEALKGQRINDPGAEDEEEFSLPDEDLIKDPVAEIKEIDGTVKVSDADKMAQFGRLGGGFHSTYDNVTRVEFNLVIRKYNLKVETIEDLYTGKTFRADLSEFGPKGSQTTWSMLSNVVQLAIEYALPLERIAKMLGIFSGKTIFNWMYKMALKFSAIYLCLGEQLAESEYVSLDDSGTKVIEVLKKIQKNLYGKEDEDRLDPLVSLIARHLGRAFEKLDGTGLKEKIHVTVIHGRAILKDPRSYIVFYRTHNGSAGNLLSRLLSMRRRKNRKITVQGDLSAQNRASAMLQLIFDIVMVGCGAHARRDFWRYKDRDPGLCGKMLRAFAMLSYVEHLIDQKGRSEEVILRYRQRYSKKIWKIILQTALDVTNAKKPEDCKGHFFWTNTAKLHKACAYIVKHFEELTAYLADPHISWTNNLSERLLRSEKMLLVSCKFRWTERGRVVFDILRTILMTCRAAQVPLGGYIKWVDSFSDGQIKANPERYTPYEYLKSLEKMGKK